MALMRSKSKEDGDDTKRLLLQDRDVADSKKKGKNKFEEF